MAARDLKSKPVRATIAAGERLFADRPFTAADLARMERQLIPLLNTVRALQGKRPVIVPGERRVKATE